MEEMARTLAEYGLWLVFGNVLLTQLGAPVPAIPTLIVAGALAQQGYWHAALVVALATVAALIGDLPWYFAGRRYGYRVLNTLCRISMEPDSCVRQTEDVFARWGPPSLMFAKFVPGFATVAPPIAGALRLPLAPFLGYSAVGAGLWAGVPRRRGRSLPRPGRSGAAAGRGDGRLRGARHSRDRGVLHRREVGGALSLPALHAHDAHQRAGASRAHAGRSAAGHTRRAFGRCAHARSPPHTGRAGDRHCQRRCCTRA